MRTSVISIALAALTLAPPAASAQAIHVEQAAPGEMLPFPSPGHESKTGTGVIRGRVYALETGQPIRRAQVRISGSDITPRAALTDVDGRFEFRDLSAGRFTLQASKSGYVSVQFGQTRPYESGRPIELVDKQVLENGDIAMPRGSVIAGRIVDEFGDPMPDVSVTAYRQSWSNGRRRLVPASGRIAQTNDLGQFRIYGLAPGDYYVSATIRSTAFETVAVDMLRATRSFAAVPSSTAPTSGYAPTYYPGTPNPAEAQTITLIAGQENHGADFALMPVRLAKVSGIVIGSDGKPLGGAMVNVTPRDRSGSPLVGLTSTRTNQDGAFTLNGVAPGDYTLQANAVQVMATSDGANRMVFTMRMGAGGPGAEAESGSLPLTVAGEDVPNLVLVTSRGGSAAGRVTFEDGAQPGNLASIRITASPIDSDGPMISVGPGSGSVKPDGAFELTGLAGARLIRVGGLPAGWTLKSVRLNGQDITDTGAEFRAGESVTGLEVVLTNRTTSITGGVIGPDGSPLKDYTVVIFADDPELWRMPRTRWVTGVRPDQEGRFKVQGMPAGTYHAVAVEYIPQGEWGDPDLLERLKGRGRRFTLEAGGVEILDLKLTASY